MTVNKRFEMNVFIDFIIPISLTVVHKGVADLCYSIINNFDIVLCCH